MKVRTTRIARRCPECGELYGAEDAHSCDPARPTLPGGPPSAGTDPGVDLVGAVLGERYEVQARIGTGGMGGVYRARHIVLGSAVAVKVLLQSQDDSAQERFLQEARLASQVRHPNTVYLSDVGVLEDGRPFLVMEFLNGSTLWHGLQGGAFDTVRVCRIGIQIARGLQAIHDQGIVHRDLKPENIFLIEQDSQLDFVKIVDFGIATREDPDAPGSLPGIMLTASSGTSLGPSGPVRLTVPGTIIGTPQYMAPEQAEGREVDHRADQYALGCLLYEMLAGESPFHDEKPLAVLMGHMGAPVPPLLQKNPLAFVPPALDALILRMLNKRRSERFPSMREVEEALWAVLQELEIKSSASLRLPRPPSISAERSLIVAVPQASPPAVPLSPPALEVPEEGALLKRRTPRGLFVAAALLLVAGAIGLGLRERARPVAAAQAPMGGAGDGPVATRPAPAVQPQQAERVAAREFGTVVMSRLLRGRCRKSEQRLRPGRHVIGTPGGPKTVTVEAGKVVEINLCR